MPVSMSPLLWVFPTWRLLTWLALLTAPLAIGIGVSDTVQCSPDFKQEPKEQKGSRPPSPRARPHLCLHRSLGVSWQDVAIRAAGEGGEGREESV